MVAIDAGISQHLDEALGVSSDPPTMGAHLIEIKEYLCGSNPRIAPVNGRQATIPVRPGRVGAPEQSCPGAAGTRARS